jgi:hypothetical protein
MYICCVNKCKNKNILTIKNIYYCKNHSIFFFNKYIKKIQKVYRAYYIRKKLKNIYFKLPEDIQKKILFFVNENIYIKKYNNVIRKIINKKTYNIILHFKLKNKLTIDNIKNIYYLNNKYRNILFLNTIKCLYVYGEEIIYILNNYIVNQFTDDNTLIMESNNIIIDLNNITNNINEIIDTITTIHNFRLNYNKESNIIKNYLY